MMMLLPKRAVPPEPALYAPVNVVGPVTVSRKEVLLAETRSGDGPAARPLPVANESEALWVSPPLAVKLIRQPESLLVLSQLDCRVSRTLCVPVLLSVTVAAAPGLVYEVEEVLTKALLPELTVLPEPVAPCGP